MSTADTRPTLKMSRLTEHDERHMVARVREVLTGWMRQGLTYDAIGHETLERIAYGAIGCSSLDLRDSELAQVSRLVAVVAADLLGGDSDFACWKLAQS